MKGRLSLHGNWSSETGVQREDVERAVAGRFGVERAFFGLVPRTNIVPGARVAVITQGRETNARYLEGYQWGLIPFWATIEDSERRLAFARAETITDKPAFRQPLISRRCIIPANGFFLFARRDDKTIPLYVRPCEDEYFAFAGVWDEWVTPQGWPLRTVALITTEANRLLAPVATRMPAILRRQDEADWLDPAHENPQELRRLLQPAPAKSLRIEAVTPRADFENFNQPSAVEPLADSAKILKSLGIAVAKPRRVLPPRKRLVRREYTSPDGQVFFKTRSFSRDEYISWHPVVDIADGHVFCDCPDFRFRHATHEPRLATPQHWCKHLTRAVENCRRHGEI